MALSLNFDAFSVTFSTIFDVHDYIRWKRLSKVNIQCTFDDFRCTFDDRRCIIYRNKGKSLLNVLDTLSVHLRCTFDYLGAHSISSTLSITKVIESRFVEVKQSTPAHRFGQSHSLWPHSMEQLFIDCVLTVGMFDDTRPVGPGITTMYASFIYLRISHHISPLSDTVVECSQWNPREAGLNSTRGLTPLVSFGRILRATQAYK